MIVMCLVCFVDRLSYDNNVFCVFLLTDYVTIVMCPVCFVDRLSDNSNVFCVFC